jgi:hypothetical protein
MAPVRQTVEQLIGIRSSEAYASGELITEAAAVAFEHTGTLRQINHKQVSRRVLGQIYQNIQQRVGESELPAHHFQELPTTYEGLVRAFDYIKTLQPDDAVALQM